MANNDFTAKGQFARKFPATAPLLDDEEWKNPLDDTSSFEAIRRDIMDNMTDGKFDKEYIESEEYKRLERMDEEMHEYIKRNGRDNLKYVMTH